MRRLLQPPHAAWALPAVVLAVALAVRLTSWGAVFAADRVVPVGDSDPHYHVLRAQRWLAGAPGAPWRDAWLAWPDGAEIPWPPLLDGLVALAARAAFGPSPTRDQVATVAVVLPVLLGLVLVLLVARLGRRLLGGADGWSTGWAAAALCALAPAATEPSRLGRADQHALEVVLLAAMLLAQAAALEDRGRRRGPAAALALLILAAFWSWPGSALHLLVLGAGAAALHLLAEGEEARAAAGRAAGALAWGAGGGAVLLVGTIAALGPPGALGRSSLTGVTGLHATLAAATALGAAILARAPAAPPSTARRLAWLAAAAGLPAALLLLVPSARAGVVAGLERLLAATPWHAEIDEFQPLLLSGRAPLGEELLFVAAGYGLLLPAAVLAFWPARPGAPAPAAPLRQDPRRLLLLVALAGLTAAALLRRRFGVYAVVPLAIAAEAGLRRVAAWLPGRLPALRAPGRQAWLLPALTLLVVAPSLPEHLAPERTGGEDQVVALEWLAGHPAWEGREAVLAPWSLGHLVQYHAGRPVLVGPFGTDLGPAAFDATASFWFTTGQGDAEAVLARTRSGVVALAQVQGTTRLLHAYAPPGTPPPFARGRDGVAGETDAFWALIPVRLYYDDGRGERGRPPLDAFRLLLESPATSAGNPAMEEQLKLFEWVRGARAEVTTAPGAEVRAAVTLVTTTGRRLEWTTVASADRQGVASLRLPYAVGANGTTEAGPWRLESAGRRATLEVGEADVVQGRAVAVVLSGARGGMAPP